MTRKVEATHAWLENILYQCKTLDPKIAQMVLGGPIALLKAQSTQTFEFCARYKIILLILEKQLKFSED